LRPRRRLAVGVAALSIVAAGTPGPIAQSSAQDCPCKPGQGGGGGQGAATPGGPSSGSRQAGGGGDSGDGGGFLPAAIAGGLGVAALAGTLGYFLVITPRRKRGLLLEALEIIEQDREESFPQAADLLDRALTAGLRAGEVTEARFALAYVQARMGKLEEASAALMPLAESGHPDREILYLDLWLKVRREQYEEASRLYDEGARELGDMLQARLLASIVYLQLGRVALRRREADRALRCFERVRDLEVLAEKVPRDVADHQVVLGIEALFDQQPEQARERFLSARHAAEREGRSTLYPELGLLLYEWRTTERPGADFDGRLSDQVRAAETEAGGSDGDLTEQRRLLRDVLVWHVVSGLFACLHLPSGGDLPPDTSEELRERLRRVSEMDPEIADPDLLEGLVQYYFAADEDERASAVALLEQACEKGANVPEVNLLVEREHALAEAAEKSVEHFLAVVKSYLGERSVPASLRRELQERLSRLERFKRLADVDVERGEADLAPSIDDLHGRAELMHRRVVGIVKPKLASVAADDAKKVSGMLEELESATKTLSKTAQELEESEQSLMIATGEFLLKEEESTDGEGG
jgi:tetratricopeptide (TPR) repeat protein